MVTLEKRGDLFLLTLTGDDDQNRFSPTVISALISTLSDVSAQATPGSVLVTTARGRFFSNGFDLAWARAADSASAAMHRLRSMVKSMGPVVAALISLPMPTIVAVNGHASGSGFLLAISHDYVLMRSDHGFLYMPEVDLGLTMPGYFSAVMRDKIRSPAALRDLILGGLKAKAGDGVRMGILDSAHDSAESTVEAAVRLGLKLAKRKWKGDVYAEIRKSMYPEACRVLGLSPKRLVSKI